MKTIEREVAPQNAQVRVYESGTCGRCDETYRPVLQVRDIALCEPCISEMFNAAHESFGDPDDYQGPEVRK